MPTTKPRAVRKPVAAPDFRHLFESMPSLYLVLDPEFKIIGATGAYLKATLIRLEDVLGRGIFEVFPDNPDDLEATGVANLSASLHRALRDRVPDKMAIQKYDIRRPDSEGGGFEEKYWSPINTPVLGPDGEVTCILHRVVDVTDTVRAEQRRLEQEALAQSLRTRADIMDNLLEGCQIISPEFRYLYVNDTVVRQGQLSREALLGRTMMETYPGIEQAPFFAALRQCMRDREPSRMENEFPQRDGTLGWFELYFQPVPEGVFILSLEITDRKRAEADREKALEDLRRTEEQFLQSQKMDAIGKLAGGVAHDFNNLLTVIAVYSGGLLKNMPAAHPDRVPVEQIKEAGERAASLTRQLLAFSRQQVLQPKVLDLNSIVINTDKMLRRLIGEDISLNTVLEQRLGHVKADPGQIEQVLMNLIVNARDAMPQGGALTIETRSVTLDEAYARTHMEVRSGPYVMLAVSDTGCGMDKATQARIFEPFFTTKDQGKGTGLGLATVFGIVKQSGGSIWVYSEPGHGSTFKIYLPMAGESLSPGKATDAVAPPTGNETILLVEDDDMVRTMTVFALRELGYQVLQASRGKEAIRICEQHPETIHLLLSDVIMPEMGGLKVSEAVRAIRPGIKVLYMSGYTDDAMLNHGVTHEEVAFLEKPFTSDSLAKKIREALARP